MEIPRECPLPQICEMYLQSSDGLKNMTTEPFIDSIVQQIALLSIELANSLKISICSVENQNTCPMMGVILSRYESMQAGNN